MIFLLYASISRILSFKNLAFALLPNPKLHNLAYSSDISLDFKGINAYNPIRTNKYDEVFNYNAETRKVMANYWAKVKIAASNAKSE